MGFCGKWVDGEDVSYPTGEKWERREVPADIAEFCHGGDGWASYYDEEDEEEPVRKALYKGGAVAHAAYLAKGAGEVCCLICQVTREEHEAKEREKAPPVAVAMGGGGGGGAVPEAPPGEPAVCECGADFTKTARARKCPPCTEALAVKALFVVPLCETHVPHLYHRKCLKDWLKRPDHNKCPVCQTEVVREGTPTHSVPPSQVSSLEAQSQ
jgi:hypothetical protein